MRLGFLHIDIPGKPEGRSLAEIMVRSAKQVMPDVEVVQLSDPMTPKVEGVDTVIRKPLEYPWIMQYRLEHFRTFPKGEAMFIDTDAVILKDPRVVFEKDFDVALTRRTGPIYVDGKDIVPDMPYNSGVMFSRSRSFWDDCFNHSWGLSDKLKNWFGDQMALKVVVNAGKHKVHELTCEEFNYSPNKPDEVITAYIAHYKGPRKKWMLNMETACAF